MQNRESLWFVKTLKIPYFKQRATKSVASTISYGIQTEFHGEEILDDSWILMLELMKTKKLLHKINKVFLKYATKFPCK